MVVGCLAEAFTAMEPHKVVQTFGFGHTNIAYIAPQAG